MNNSSSVVLKSFGLLKRNPIVFLPSLLSLPFFVLLALFVVLQVLAGDFLGLFSLEAFDIRQMGAVPLAVILFFLIVDCLLALLIALYWQAAQWGVLADVVFRGKSSFSRLLAHGKRFFLPVVTFSLASLLVIVVPALVLAAIVFLLFQLSAVAGILVGILLGLAYILFLVLFQFVTVFSPPLLVTRRLFGFAVLRESLKYARMRPGHVLFTAAVSLLLGIALNLLAFLVGLPSTIIDIMQSYGMEAGVGLLVVRVIFEVLSTLVGWVGGIIIMLYVFGAFAQKNKVSWK